MNRRCSSGSKSERGHKPKVPTKGWVFHEDCINKKKNRRDAGTYVSEWREKYDTLPKPYKEIVTSTPHFLPSIKQTRSSSSSMSSRQNSVYTRYTIEQLRRKKEVDKIEQMVYQPPGLSERLDDRINNSAYKDIETIFDPPHDEENEDLEDENDEEGTFNLNEANGNQQTMDSEQLEAVVEYKKKNLYIYYAKPPKPTREDRLKAKLEKKKKKKEAEEEKNPWGSPEEHRLKAVLQEFCEWVTELGGDESNIDESTLRCLFASGYDTTPAMSVPIVLVKPSDVPPALREASAVPTASYTPEVTSQTAQTAPDEIKTDRNAYRYGAWYLRPKTWKRMRKDEMLMNPKQLELIENKTGLETKKKELAEDLSHLYITRAFSDYLKVKGTRVPEFIVEANRIRQETEDLEKEKAEAEERDKQEYLLRPVR